MGNFRKYPLTNVGETVLNKKETKGTCVKYNVLVVEVASLTTYRQVASELSYDLRTG